MRTFDVQTLLRRALAGLALLLAAAVAVPACDDDDDDGKRDTGVVDAGRDGAADGPGDARDGGSDAPSDVGGGDGVTDAGGDLSPDGGMIAANRPVRRDFTPERLAQLQVPAGFRVTTLATNLINPRWMATQPDGSLYVTSPMMGQVLRLADGNGDGDADDAGERTVVATAQSNPALMGVHGIAIHQGKVYLASVKAVVSATIGGDGSLGGFTTLVADLPDGGQHPNRTLAIGPDDGKLYVTVGSDCNACAETNSEHATVLRLNLDGSAASNDANPQHPMKARNAMATISPRVFASGLRNVLGFDWHPVTKQLWGSEHGSDGLGNDIPPDELLRLQAGKSYGWPYCYGDKVPDPTVDEPSQMLTKAAYCPTTEPLAFGYQAHSAPIGFVFYTGTQFPAAYRNDAFVAFRGSWNRQVPTGYKVVRVHFENGVPAAGGGTPLVSDFLGGFLIEGGAAHFGRIAGLAIDASGALLVAEDTNGVIYRVSYGGVVRDGGAEDAGDAGVDAAVDAATD
jgi:glucose/arabinose dehydrogenase